MMNAWYMHHSFENMLFPSPFISLPFLVILAVVLVAIKGYALWHAARNEQKWWFVFLLIINGLGIPELVYLVWFRADKQTAKIAPAPAPAPAPSTTRDTGSEEA